MTAGVTRKSAEASGTAHVLGCSPSITKQGDAFAIGFHGPGYPVLSQSSTGISAGVPVTFTATGSRVAADSPQHQLLATVHGIAKQF